MNAHGDNKMAFGETVVQDYEAFFPSQRKWPKIEDWFYDKDTRSILADCIDRNHEYMMPDTIYLVVVVGGWCSVLKLLHKDTIVELKVKDENGYRTIVAKEWPFGIMYSNRYINDLRAWDKGLLTQDNGEMILDAPIYYVTRLIYDKECLISIELCVHQTKSEYFAESFDGDWQKQCVIIPYPEGKEWPRW